jgi:hypothetical protein
MDSNLRFPDRSAPVFETGVPFPWRFNGGTTRNLEFARWAIRG